MPQPSNRNPASCRARPAGLSDDDIYLMVMLHQYQRMSCTRIARRFGVSTGLVQDLIAARTGGSCCG